jgi:hypothetical protein
MLRTGFDPKRTFRFGYFAADFDALSSRRPHNTIAAITVADIMMQKSHTEFGEPVRSLLSPAMIPRTRPTTPYARMQIADHNQDLTGYLLDGQNGVARLHGELKSAPVLGH